MFAIKHYDNPQAVGEKEFYDDMKRFKYLKRLFKKHSTTGHIKRASHYESYHSVVKCY